MGIGIADKVGKEMADALGLKHCRMIDIHFEANKPAIVTAEFLPEADGIRQFPAITKKYSIEEIQEPPRDGEKGKA